MIMNYSEFKNDYEKKLLNNPSLLNAADLDLYSHFDRYENMDIGAGHNKGNVHRCHLVEDFLREFNIEAEVEKKDIAYSLGIKHSLDILMDIYQDEQWFIASDNYPVYLDKALKHKLFFDTFPTLDQSLKSSLRDSDNDNDILLLSYPFKPSGRLYEAEDWTALKEWQEQKPNRIIILDIVYCLDLSKEIALFQLFNESKNVILLYSLSKSYAAPNVAGFTFTKNNDLRRTFQSLVIPSEKLHKSFTLLNTDVGKERRALVNNLLEEQYDKAIKLGILSKKTAYTGYLYYLNLDFSESILTVPTSVFQSNAQGYIVSTLSI